MHVTAAFYYSEGCEQNTDLEVTCTLKCLDKTWTAFHACAILYMCATKAKWVMDHSE